MRILEAKGLPFCQVSKATVPFLLGWCFEPQTSSYFIVPCLLTSFLTRKLSLHLPISWQFLTNQLALVGSLREVTSQQHQLMLGSHLRSSVEPSVGPMGISCS